MSAIRTTLAPAVPAYPGPGDTSELVVVPLLVFRGDGDGSGSETDDPATAEVSPTLREVVDVAQVSEAVSAMALPQQEVLVVGAVHLFRDHPQVRWVCKGHRGIVTFVSLVWYTSILSNFDSLAVQNQVRNNCPPATRSYYSDVETHAAGRGPRPPTLPPTLSLVPTVLCCVPWNKNNQFESRLWDNPWQCLTNMWMLPGITV